MKSIYIRCDDVYELDDNLITYLDIVKPITNSVSVIPNRLTKECAKYLAKNEIIVNQHGSCHVKGKDNILDGYNGMNNFFSSWSKIYVPPWNIIYKDELEELERLEYVGISSDVDASNQIKKYGLNLISIPIHFELMKYSLSNENYYNTIKLLEEFIDSNNLIGILVHYRNIINFDNFSKFISLLESKTLCCM